AAIAQTLANRADVDCGRFQVTERGDSRVILRLREKLGCYAPDLLRTHARRKTAAEHMAIDKPVRLRIAADHGRGQEWHQSARLICASTWQLPPDGCAGMPATRTGSGSERSRPRHRMRSSTSAARPGNVSTAGSAKHHLSTLASGATRALARRSSG